MRSAVRRALLAGTIASVLVAVNPPASAVDGTPGCVKAQRKVASEERWTARASAAIERVRKARESCAAPQACGRYVAQIREMETRKLRHDVRLSKFRADAARSCAAG